VYGGSVGIGASTIGVGVVAGSVVNGSLPTTGAKTFVFALIAMILIFGGLILLRLAAVRRANEALTIEARSTGLHAALGLEHDGSKGLDRIDRAGQAERAVDEAGAHRVE